MRLHLSFRPRMLARAQRGADGVPVGAPCDSTRRGIALAPPRGDFGSPQTADVEHALAAGPALRAGRRDLPARAGQAAGRVMVHPSAWPCRPRTSCGSSVASRRRRGASFDAIDEPHRWSERQMCPSSTIRASAARVVASHVGRYAQAMARTLTAVVQNGRIVVDEPTTLPDGTVLKLQAADPGDTLDDEERAELHAAIGRGKADVVAGRVRDAREVIKELRARR